MMKQQEMSPEGKDPVMVADPTSAAAYRFSTVD
jgi:hypothetical protein